MDIPLYLIGLGGNSIIFDDAALWRATSSDGRVTSSGFDKIPLRNNYNRYPLVI